MSSKNRMISEIISQMSKEGIIYDQQGLKPGTPYERGQWIRIVSHNVSEIKGFFGEYRFLSNFWPARVFLDGEEYFSVENAYQAAKYKKDDRDYFKTCSAPEAKRISPDNFEYNYSEEEWNDIKLQVMYDLLVQKFDETLNPELNQKLKETGNRYLEETNWWGDIYWGVNKGDASEDGVGENNLGRLIMRVREIE